MKVGLLNIVLFCLKTSRTMDNTQLATIIGAHPVLQTKRFIYFLPVEMKVSSQ